MTVSTTQTFNLNFREIAELAYDRAGGEEVTGYDQIKARKLANVLMQDLQVRNVNLWTVEYRTLNLTLGNYSGDTLAADVVDLLDMFVYDSSQATRSDLPIERISRAKYALIPDKTSQGLPYQIYVDRQRDAPVLYAYQTPSISSYVLGYYFLRRTYDQSAFADTMDAPVRWMPTLIAGMAYYIGLGRRVKLGIQFVKELQNEFELAYGIAIKEDSDPSALRLQPDLSMYFH